MGLPVGLLDGIAINTVTKRSRRNCVITQARAQGVQILRHTILKDNAQWWSLQKRKHLASNTFSAD